MYSWAFQEILPLKMTNKPTKLYGKLYAKKTGSHDFRFLISANFGLYARLLTCLAIPDLRLAALFLWMMLFLANLSSIF